MGSVQTFEPTWALIRRPQGYNSTPAPGKLEQIWTSNTHNLYHKLSPYTSYNTTLIGGFTSEPFYWIYPDEAGKGLSGLKMAEAKYDSRLFPLGSAPIDVIRVSKFLGSGRGIPFLVKQFLLQTGNAFNETRIYNPTSPIVAAAMGLGLGSIRPQRFIDTSGGLLGIARSLIGPAASLFGEPKVNPPSGTVGLGALSDTMKSVGGKGLIRAGTANRAQSHLEAAWPATSGGGFASSFGKVVKGLVTSLFQNFIPQTQSGIRSRSDEGAYGLMVGGGNGKFDSLGASGTNYAFGQLWIAGGSTIRKNAQYPTRASRVFAKYSGGIPTNTAVTSNGGFTFSIAGLPNGTVGYTISPSSNPNKPGYRYGDSVGDGVDHAFESSDVNIQYSFYADPAQPFPTKDPDSQKVKTINQQLAAMIQKMRNASDGLYTVTPPPGSVILRDGSVSYDYNRLFKTAQPNSSPINYDLGVLKAYRDTPGVSLVDNTIAPSIEKSFKLPTNGNFDALNTLEVLDKGKKIPADKMRLKSWDEWRPYEDDLIALFFYDVVNEKYIPFRASIKGLNEAGNASWEEMPFIGRADKVYSYGGFNRNASFNIKVVISSIAELAPTWQRINYMTTAIKPANYTTANLSLNNNVSYNRFMVPPMFMLTMGDLYKDQPVLIQSITTTIPDDAAWETLNEDNQNNTDWNYLAKIIKSPKVLYGQVPREIELGFSLILLEKERAVVGGANFGHAPRNEDWSGPNLTAIPNGGTPNKFDQSLVVQVTDENTPPPVPNSGVTQTP